MNLPGTSTLPQTIIEVHSFFIQQTWKCTANSGSYMAVHLQNLCANIEAAPNTISVRARASPTGNPRGTLGDS